ncbi:uncharacterized protein [Physcomitrium patens]|uniref:uncharacterized protein n=1 Tax=Physcomitrium patens TaxID=3218 RepID=UPI00016202F2
MTMHAENEEEPVHASITPAESLPDEPIETAQAAPTRPAAGNLAQPQSYSPFSFPPPADDKLPQHDPVLIALPEELKLQPLELVTSVINFLFRVTEFGNESGVEHKMAEIMTLVKLGSSAGEVGGVVSAKVAEFEGTKTPIKEFKPPTSELHKGSPISSLMLKQETNSPADDSIIDESEGVGLQPNLGDGHDHEKYSWTQTLSEVSVHIPLPSGTKAKSVLCEIKTKTLKSGIKSQKLALEGEFYNLVKSDGCFWSLERDGTLSIFLTKCNGMELWSCVLPEMNFS